MYRVRNLSRARWLSLLTGDTVFLRRLEYFRGILFLTTNRPAQIDEAFTSRIQAIIGYPRLTDDKRNKIWATFFDKLIEDMKSDRAKGGKKRRIKVSERAREYLLSDEEVKAVKWNGREIRNAFQTAVALAEYDALRESDRVESDPITVELSHFQDVVKLSAKFRKYMERFGDDAKRAFQAKVRDDYEKP